ncbi:hypothetical protein IFR05_009114 [Cadophora sp. M221]|nr:hypothetical protein IFR05_009114 [Cadophora sp. M221]
MIFDLTLKNPILGTRESVEVDDACGHNTSYGLSPNLLLVSKRINQAGTQFLYRKNVFYMAYLPTDAPHSWDINSLVNLTPITRHVQPSESQYPFMDDLNGLQKVQHWNVVVDLIQVKLIPRGIVESSHHYLDTAAAPNPLRLLRNVKEFSITDALPSEIPDTLFQNATLTNILSQMKDQSSLETELEMLATLEAFDIEQFVELYRVALKEIESFWLGICEARKRLFKLDTLDERDCDIDPEIHRCTDRIDWTVLEPEIGPENGYFANVEEYELPDSDGDDDDSESHSDSDGDSNGDSYSTGAQDDADVEDPDDDSGDLGGSADDDGIRGEDPAHQGVSQVAAEEDNGMGMLSLEDEENMGGAVATDDRVDSA